MIIKELTQEERFTWGECPVCSVKHGERCNGDVGIALGRNIHGEIPEGGVHLGRLERAPFRVELRPLP